MGRLVTAADELLQDSPAARPCLHPRANHQHGTRAGYTQDRCRCRPCTDAAYRAAKESALRRLEYGRWAAYSDADPIRAHIHQLLNAGLSLKAITRLSGVSRPTLRRLLYGQPSLGIPPAVRVLNRTAERLRAITTSRQRAAADDLFAKEVVPHGETA